MRRIHLVTLVLIVAVVVGCAPAPATPTTTPPPRTDFKIGLVTNAQGTIRDGTFNESAYVGAATASRDFNLQLTYKETIEDKDYPSAIQAMIDGGYNIIVTVGFQMQTDTLAAAAANPKLFFIGVDQVPGDNPPANFLGLQFAEDQGGFLAGAIAGMMTKTNVVGVVAGIQIPPVERFVQGFINGARYVNPNVQALNVYTTSFADPMQGTTEADKLIGQQADVIFGAGGLTGSSAIVHAATKGKFVIGVDSDEYRTTFKTGKDAERILTSAVKRVDMGVYQAVGQIVNGGFTPGILTLTAAQCGITYAPFNRADDAIPAPVKTRLEAIWRAMAGNTLQTGVGGTAPEPLSGDALPPIAANAPKLADCTRG